jgi:pilus assembly protein CpaB
MRAVTVPVNLTSGVAGFIFPGDRVDVIMTHRVRVSELPNVNRHARRTQSYNLSETILSNVRVLGVDQFSENTASGVKVRKSATLEVTPKIAEKIAVMRRVGRLSLALRSLAQSDDAEPLDISTPPLDKTISTTQAGELSQFLPKFDPFAKPPVKRQVIVNRGASRSVVNLGKAREQLNLNEINSLPINSDFEETQIIQEGARPDRGDN